MTTVQEIQLRLTTHAFSMPKRQIPFLSSVLRGDIQKYCKFEPQSPDNMTIVNKLLYIDSYCLASMVIFSNVLKQLFGKKLFQNNFSLRIINRGPQVLLQYIIQYTLYTTQQGSPTYGPRAKCGPFQKNSGPFHFQKNNGPF